MAEEMATATETAAPAVEEEEVARDSDCDYDDDGDEVTPPGRITVLPEIRVFLLTSRMPHSAWFPLLILFRLSQNLS